MNITKPTAETQQFTIDFEPIGRRVVIPRNKTLLEAAQSAGIDLLALCGGAGTCESCRVKLMAGKLTPPTLDEEAVFSNEDLVAGYRLACQCYPQSDIKIHIPPDSLTTPQRLQIEGREVVAGSDTVIKMVDFQLSPPSLHDLLSDEERLTNDLSQQGTPVSQISYLVLTQLSDQLRQQNWQGRAAVRDDQAVAVLAPGEKGVGLAVDIGTTKIAAYLIDLENGETIAKQGMMNPQISYGEDVVSRIAYTNDHPDGRKTLQLRLIETLNQMIETMSADAGIQSHQIVEAVVVGNTVIHHLFCRLPVEQLGLVPYIPTTNQPLNIPAAQLGLTLAPGAIVYLPPNIAGYVGADHVAMVLATETYLSNNTVIALDIGTNTEITLNHQGKMRCCSCASGPAFEGAHIRDGMRAASGAIERVRIDDDRVILSTISGQLPVGICGSGILDAVSELVRNKVVDTKGVIRENAPNVHGIGRLREFVLCPAAKTGHGRDVTLSRQDINEIQLAKAAIRSGIEILLIEAGIDASQIDHFIVAGAFGTYLDVSSAIRIGMFPNLPLARFDQVGNAAGTGAREMLVSAHKRQAANELPRHETYVELTTHASFQKIFLRSMYF